MQLHMEGVTNNCKFTNHRMKQLATTKVIFRNQPERE